MRESDVERYLVEQVESIGGLCYKWVSPGTRGVPDRLVILPGRATIYVELKKADRVLSPNQVHRLDTLTKLGQECHVIWSKVQVDEFTSGHSTPWTPA